MVIGIGQSREQAATHDITSQLPKVAAHQNEEAHNGHLQDALHNMATGEIRVEN